jgi:hypothetical protein
MRKGHKTWITLAALLLAMATPVLGGGANAFGPESFVVGKGKPVTVTRSFTANAGQATLTLNNGTEQGDNQVSTGSISINGIDIITPSDFNQQVGTLVRTVMLKGSNQLAVEVGGGPGSIITLVIIPDEGTPPPTVPTARLQADPETVSPGDDATLSWTTTNAERVTINPGLGDVALSGMVQVRPTQTTLYRLVAEGTGGQAVAEVTVSVKAPPAPLGITFDPYQGGTLDGATVEGLEITVAGRVTVANQTEVGVTVNGVVAQVSDGHFVANHVSLTEGLNTLTGIATDAAGQTWSASAQVFCRPEAERVSLKTDVMAGIVPLTVTLSVTDNLTQGVGSFSLQCTGPADKTPVAGDDNTFSTLLDVPGLYTCRLSVVDGLGMVHEDTVGVNAYSATTLDSLLKSKWDATTAAIGKGDLDVALASFSTRTREAYALQFAGMSTALGQIVSDMQGINLLRIEGDRAIYDLRIVKDGVPYSFQLEFIQDEDGLWRIRAF